MRKGLAFLKNAMVALAMVGIVFPQTRVFAGQQKLPPKSVTKVLAANAILDVSLNKENAFIGRAVDHTGAPVEGVKIIAKQGAVEVAQSVTDKDGKFAMPNMKSGLYQVSSGDTEGSYRLWSEKSAPPVAKPMGMLVVGENGARGQFGMSDMDGFEILLLAGVAAALAVGIAALVLAADADRKAGTPGPAGPKGARGAAGPQGPQGPPGSP